MKRFSLKLTLPDWVESFLGECSFPLKTVDSRMRFVIDLSLENVRHKTGGPFAAALFDRFSGELIAPGVNRVVPLYCSLAHAEMLAIGLAQRRLGTFDLGAPGCPEIELVTSTEPCAMCFGAIPWSGVRSLVCGATDADARAVGFEEGAKMVTWTDELQKRGISVQTEVLREEAAQALRAYAAAGGIIYNGRSSAALPI